MGKLVTVAYTISISKDVSRSGFFGGISKEEFVNVVESDDDLEWLQESSAIPENVKRMHAGDLIAIWPYQEEIIWFQLNDQGIIDFGYRVPSSRLHDPVLDKFMDIAGKLNAYVVGEDGRIFYDPTG